MSIVWYMVGSMHGWYAGQTRQMRASWYLDRPIGLLRHGAYNRRIMCFVCTIMEGIGLQAYWSVACLTSESQHYCFTGTSI